MADVRLSIAGRPYDVHCADGQEDRIRQLAAIIDEKARSVQGGTEVRQLLFASLMLADETQEARGKVEKAAPQSDSLRAAVALAEARAATEREAAALAELETLRQGAPVVPAPPSGHHDRALMQIADRIEALATKVEQIP